MKQVNNLEELGNLTARAVRILVVSRFLPRFSIPDVRTDRSDLTFCCPQRMLTPNEKSSGSLPDEHGKSRHKHWPQQTSNLPYNVVCLTQKKVRLKCSVWTPNWLGYFWSNFNWNFIFMAFAVSNFDILDDFNRSFNQQTSTNSNKIIMTSFRTNSKLSLTLSSVNGTLCWRGGGNWPKLTKNLDRQYQDGVKTRSKLHDRKTLPGLRFKLVWDCASESNATNICKIDRVCDKSFIFF